MDLSFRRKTCFKIVGSLLALSFVLIAVPGSTFPKDDFLPFYGGELQITRVAEASPESYWDNLWLLARVIQGEAEGEPFLGKVAVGAVLLNRMRSASFPNTLAGVIFQPLAFESVANGLIWWRTPSLESIRAAAAALSGWDPTYGALYFWNPAKPVNPWIWTRLIVTQIGRHIFAR
ncbi:MAG: cell wall hydrolase [Bacillota bacterium]|jgi:N-acetylmuramoyl-L-alanine amidase|nr:cell wall hydrolase [Bacillota bacterium]